MKRIGTLMILALFAITVACSGTDTTSTTVGGVQQAPVHSHQLLEY